MQTAHIIMCRNHTAVPQIHIYFLFCCWKFSKSRFTQRCCYLHLIDRLGILLETCNWFNFDSFLGKFCRKYCVSKLPAARRALFALCFNYSIYIHFISWNMKYVLNTYFVFKCVSSMPNSNLHYMLSFRSIILSCTMSSCLFWNLNDLKTSSLTLWTTKLESETKECKLELGIELTHLNTKYDFQDILHISTEKTMLWCSADWYYLRNLIFQSIESPI